MATATKKPLKKRLTLKDLVDKTIFLIDAGRVDNYLEDIMAACNARRRVVRDQLVRHNMRELNKVGTRVRITSYTIKPRYLLGLAGQVVNRPEDYRNSEGVIYVDIGRRVNKYGPIVGVPAAALEEA